MFNVFVFGFRFSGVRSLFFGRWVEYVWFIVFLVRVGEIVEGGSC